MILRHILLALVMAMVCADEWSFSLSALPAAEQRIDLRGIDLSNADHLHVTWRNRDLPAGSMTWMEFDLVASDGRWFISSAPVAIRADRSRDSLDLPLESGWWAGREGSLGGDALSAVRELRVRLHGGSGGSVEGVVATVARRIAPRFAVESESSGLVEREDDGGKLLWREWRLRLVGDLRGSTGSMELLRADGSRLPFFLEQPAVVADGVWRPHAAPRWVLRLRGDERILEPARLVWQGGGRDWTSGPLTVPSEVTSREALPAVPTAALPVPEAPPWRGYPAQWADGGFRRSEAVELPACPAPALVWRADWTGFRGPQSVGHLQALAVDRLFASAREFDLLPGWLAEEQGSFRFGLAPWHVSQHGPWQYAQDLLADDRPWRDWRNAARDLIARGRAAPQLQRWRLGLTATANDQAQVERLLALERDLVAMVAGSDGRPVFSLHPQVVGFARRDPEGLWADFEKVDDGWKSHGGVPFGAGQNLQLSEPGSNGAHALLIPFARVGTTRIGGVARDVDANLMNLDRLEFDAQCVGPAPAAVQFYAWCTDRHHRWYQQRLAYQPCAPRWNTVLVEFGSAAPWLPVGHSAAWDGDQRLQMRRIGLVAFIHDDAGDVVKVSIDRIRRLGWPSESAPALTINDLVVSAPASRYAAIAADFRLSVPSRNPYDPELADVVGEVEGPDGKRLTYPAYWAEPFDLTFTDGRERAKPSGSGAWHWRFGAPTAGVWRWRITAAVKWRDQTLRAESPWQSSTVPDRLPPLKPVRVSTKDPQWFEHVDGSWWYPVGMNLRSPGDSRQDDVLRQQAAGHRPDLKGNLLTTSTLGWTSADFEKLGTRAFERWFSHMEQARMNWARVWMAPWWCGLEWTRQWDEFGGLTVFNQAAATRLDRVMELAAQHGVYVQLELQNHGMTSTRTDQEWNPDGRGNFGSPYSSRNGGPCNSAAEFYQREEVWAIHEKRLRYTLARWGHLSHLAAFVLSSELEFTEAFEQQVSRQAQFQGGHSEVIAKWVRRSLRWFTEHDPTGRPVSIHFSHPWADPPLWREPGLGFSNSNAYTGFQEIAGILGGPGAGLDGALAIYLDKHYPPWELKRPTLIGEWGGHWADNTVTRLAQELHTGVWMQAALPYGANTGYWWWLWVDAADAWNEYRAVVDFATADDPRGRGLRTTRAKANHILVKNLGSRSADLHRYYVWIKDLDLKQRKGLADAGTLDIETGLPGSRWKVERRECRTGTVSEETEATAADNGIVTVTLGALEPDAAFTLRKQ